MPELSTEDVTVIERLIDAPITHVWSMWTDPVQFAVWYGPPGASIDTARLDVQPGGERAVAMTVQTPGGARTMWFTGVHVEVVELRLLVYTEAMTDRDGGAPQSAVTTVRLELTADENQTRLRLIHHGSQVRPSEGPSLTPCTSRTSLLLVLTNLSGR